MTEADRTRIYSIREWDVVSKDLAGALDLFIKRLKYELENGTMGWSALDCRCPEEGEDCGCEEECVRW